MSPFKPADFAKGDPNTLGGYAAVHARPAAFEGADGTSYSAEIVLDEHSAPGLAAQRFSGYVLFVEWRREDPVAAGHLESDYLAHGATAEEVRGRLGTLSLQETREMLDKLIAERGESSQS